MAHLQLVLDVADVDASATFWAAALGYRPYGRFGQYRSLVDPEGTGPKLVLQQVTEPRSGKNRMHLDVHVADIEAEATRLEGLGAVRVDDAPIEEAGTAWLRMTDPEGNEFCVCRLD